LAIKVFRRLSELSGAALPAHVDQRRLRRHVAWVGLENLQIQRLCALSVPLLAGNSRQTEQRVGIPGVSAQNLFVAVARVVQSIRKPGVVGKVERLLLLFPAATRTENSRRAAARNAGELSLR
jgi:hypothetical protein